MEIWAIDKDWNTLAKFASFDEADLWYRKNEFFQVVYKTTENSGIHVYVDRKEFVNSSVCF